MGNLRFRAWLSSDKRFANRSIELVDDYTKYLLKEWWRVDYKKIMDSLFKENFELEQQRDQYKAERDTLIDDLSWYKAKVSRLERELEKKNMDADRLGYRWRNSHDEAKTYKSLLSEFSQHIGNKPSSSTYKYFRAKLDGIGIKEDD